MPVQNIHLAVDAIIFGYKKSHLFVLLIKPKSGPFANVWCLPGGFVNEEESLRQAVERELLEETGISVNYLEQLYTFGNVGRDPRKRVVSVAYFGLVDPSKLSLVEKTETDAEAARWFAINELPPLGYDHPEIVATALERLRAKLSYQPIGFDLLPDKFPFSDLENLYASILEKEIDRRNFRKKIMSFGFLRETDAQIASGKGRPANLFQFDKTRYEQLSKENFLFEIKFA
ncbi:NUDIX hydrolase [Flavobacterium selenitireducens]|uniref:NUDIX hydrolase n=1 Tax=Flavobacterium selenitireducens TaxID=2722704 RepID=UPI00168AD9A4|nr:NUDIX domain-containing protein [Flavobacterium selenitireducens]MBD3582552.1 NUDIX hydrolase [Flavobacterium selenitireducens]